ncbi:MAG TPA: hypothetical protein VM820_20400 [Vicinamibacterales bacterium]|nr:hypothetical protein [Vicinamibacterales bacterium]
MPSPWTSRLALLAGAVAASGVLVATAQQKPEPLALGPFRERGASVTPAFEGWYENEDGSFSMLVGYYNRNSKQPLDIPIGANNRIEPGDPDQGQPTHFETGRQWGVFVLKVPKDFGKKTMTWTIVANGEPQSIPLSLNPGYPITPYKELGMGNQPPALSFSQGGAKVTGPPAKVAATLTGKAGQPVPIQVWVEDPKPEGESESASPARGKMAGIATVSFHKYRGPGTVTFDKARIPASKQGEMVEANATFETAGDHMLRVQANDESGEGGGGFQCCWTNTYVKVTVQ